MPTAGTWEALGKFWPLLILLWFLCGSQSQGVLTSEQSWRWQPGRWGQGAAEKQETWEREVLKGGPQALPWRLRKPPHTPRLVVPQYKNNPGEVFVLNSDVQASSWPSYPHATTSTASAPGCSHASEWLQPPSSLGLQGPEFWPKPYPRCLPSCPQAWTLTELPFQLYPRTSLSIPCWVRMRETDSKGQASAPSFFF